MSGWVNLADEDIVLGERIGWGAPPLRTRKLVDGTVEMSGLMRGRRIMLRLPDGHRPDPGRLPPTKAELLNPRFDELGAVVSSDGVKFTSFFAFGPDVYLVAWVERTHVPAATRVVSV